MTTRACACLTHSDPIEADRHKGAMCAEALVPDRVSPGYLLGVYVPCTPAKRTFDAQGTALPAVVNRDMFFGVCER